MVKLIILVIAIWLLLLTAAANNMVRELTELKARDRLRGQEIRANRGYIGLVDDKCDRIKAEVRDMVKPFTHIIPVRKGWWLGVREENEDKND